MLLLYVMSENFILIFVFSVLARGRLRRASPKWCILCGVRCKTVTQSIS